MKDTARETRFRHYSRYTAACAMVILLMFFASGCSGSQTVDHVVGDDKADTQVVISENTGEVPEEDTDSSSESGHTSVSYIDNRTSNTYNYQTTNRFEATSDGDSGYDEDGDEDFDDDYDDDEDFDDDYDDDEDFDDGYDDDEDFDGDDEDGDDDYGDGDYAFYDEDFEGAIDGYEYADYHEGSGDGHSDDLAAYVDVDEEHDYSDEAMVRTSEFSFSLRHPTVGATEAVIRTDFTNYRGSAVTMAGCSVYDFMGRHVASRYVPVSITDSTGTFEYDLGKDLGLILNRGETYYYRFAVMVDGELFTHDRGSFMTNKVDDTFAIEYLDPEIGASTIRTGIRVYNPTGAHVTKAGIRVALPTGLYVADDVKAIDESGSEFTVNFDLISRHGQHASDQEYVYIIYIEYNGKAYETQFEELRTLV